MSEELAKAVRARRTEEAPPAAPPRSPARPGLDSNSARADRDLARPPLRSPAEALRLQSDYGNAALFRAARAGGPGPSRPPLARPPVAAPGPATRDATPAPFAPAFAPDAATGNGAEPADFGAAPAFDPTAGQFPPLSTFPPAAAAGADVFDPYAPAPESAEGSGEVTTIVFDEEQIVGRAGAREEGEEREEPEPKAAAGGGAGAEERAGPKKEEAPEQEARAGEEAGGAREAPAAPTEQARAEAAAKAQPEEVAREAEAGAEPPPAEEEVEGAKRVAGQGVIEADPEAAKGGAAARAGGGPPPEEGAGGEAAPELAGWKSKVSGATRAIRQPDLGDAAEAGGRVRKVGGAARERAVSARGRVAEEAEKVIPPPPPPPDPLPPPREDPTNATQLVRDASDQKLPNQKLPVLAKTPLGTMPKMSAELSAAYSTKVMTESAVAEAEKAKAEAAAKGEDDAAQGAKDPQREKGKKIKDAKKQKKKVEGSEAQAEPLVLVDEGAPPPAPMTKTTQTDVGKVLAVIAADPLAAAEEMVKEAREAAYPEGSLLHPNYDDFGEEVLPGVETELRAQLTAIREQAGISKEELDQRVAERRQQLIDEKKTAAGDLEAAKKDEAERVREEGEKNARAVAGARETMDLNTERQLEAAGGESDPTLIKMKRERLLRGVGRKVAQQVVSYTQAGERREKALSDMESPIQSAYVLAARADETKIYDDLLKATRKEKDPEKEKERLKTARDQAGLAANPSFVWVKTKLTEVGRQIGALKTEAKQAAGRLVAAVRTAGERATEAIRKWADGKMGTLRGWWERFLDLIREWGKKADYEAEAWEQARNSAERDAVVRDLDALGMVEKLEARKIDASGLAGAANLTDEQRAVIKSFYEGPAKGNKIAAVAAGMRARLSARQRPEMFKKFEGKLNSLPAGRWDHVDDIATAQQPGGMTADKIASEVHWAIDGIGTNEARIFAALSNITPLRALAARLNYRARGWGDMDEDIKDDLGGEELTRARAQLSGDQALADAAALREAIAGIGTDEKAIMEVLRNKTPEEQRAIIAAYKREYGDDLDADLKDDLDGHDLQRAEALRAGDVTRADAIAVDQALHGGFFGGAFGGNKEEVEAVYTQRQQEVEARAAAEGWDAARTEEEVRKGNAALSKSYADVKGIRAEEGRDPLREDLKKQFKGPEEDLALALHDNDPVAADAARIEIERRSVFYASDETLGNIFKAQGERARRESQRDAAAAELKLQERIAIAELRGFPLDEKEITAEREKIAADFDKNVKERAGRYMSALEKTYDEKHGKYGRGSLQFVIALNMSGSDRDKAFDLIKGGGLLTPEQELNYAMREEDAEGVQALFAGKKKEEVDALIKAWEEKHGRKFEAFVESEFGGRDLFDIKQKMKGEPQTPEEKLQRAEEEMAFEETAYGAAGAFSKDERKYMKDRVAALRRDVERLKKLEQEGKKGTPEYDRVFKTYKAQTARFELAVKDHREQIDSVTDTAATIAAIVATVVAIVVISILTAGAGTAVLAAVMAGMTKASVAAGAAVAATIATVAVKQGFKGRAYTRDELTDDLTVGAVEAVASALTAGLGGRLLAAGRLAKLSQSGKIIPRLFANAMSEGAEGLASSLPGALTGALVNDKNWKGDPFANIVGGTLIGVGMGTVLSGGMGMLGGISKPAARGAGKVAGEAGDAAEALAAQARRNPPVESPDLLARRGSPAERLAGWESFKRANPGKSYDDFIAELDAGGVAHKADDAAVGQMKRRLRDELFTDVPPGQRDQFKDVAVDVVSDAEFERLTRSAKGQAVVLIEEGRPRVLLRESADPKVLREEGIHLLQSVDPKKAHLFRQLDEGVLAKWDELPLDEQLGLYGKKLDLEIDGQQRLIRNLEEQLAAAGDDAAARKQILGRLEEAQETLDNLSRRLDEVGDLTPQQRLDIGAGKAPRPDYLDQPARLFAKKAESPDFVKSLRAAGADMKEARRILDEAHARSGAKKQLAATLTAVSDRAKTLDPPKAKAYLEEVLKALDSRADAVDALADLVALSAKSKDPLAAVGAAKKLAGAGLDEGDRITKAALGDMTRKLSALKPEAAQKVLASLGEVIDAFPHKPVELSGFIASAAKHRDPTPFIGKLKSLSEFLKAQPGALPEGSLRHVGDKLADLGAGKRGAAYFDALDDLLRAHPGHLDHLDGFLVASTRSADPAGYLGIVKELNSRKAGGTLSKESFEVLSKKAAAGSIDLEWLSRTPLFKHKTPPASEVLDFLAFDKNTPWADFMLASQIKPHRIKAAWRDPKLRKILMSTSKAVRGAAGELAVLERATALLKSIGYDLDELLRQTALVGTVSDYVARLKSGIEMGLEVKSHSQTFWRNFKRAEEIVTDLMSKGKTFADAYKTLNDRQKASYNSIWNMLKKQLPASAAAMKHAPVLIISDVVGKIGGWGAIEMIIRTHLPPGTQLIKLSEADIVAKSKLLRKLLEIP